MSTQLAAELVRLLGIKKELLNNLLVSLRRSVCFLQEDDMDAFDNEMDICQDITSKVDELHLSLDRIKEQVVPSEEIAALKSDIADILKKIDLARKECNDMTEQKLHTYGRQIKTIRHAQKGIDGYVKQFVRRDAVFVDKKK